LSKNCEGKGVVLIRNEKYGIVVVTMDQAMVDLKRIRDDLKIGEEVVILGKQQRAYIDPEVAATQIGIGIEEMLCQINPRIPRIFID